MRIFTLKKYTDYQLAVFLSSLSLAFGVLREFLIIGLLGFTAKNDLLQIYLSIFYTIGLAIDAMRLSCLNLFAVLSLPRLLFSASLIGLPFAALVGLLMNYSTQGMDPMLLTITILGSYCNLMAAMLITYQQRNHFFLAAQIVNVLPNFILIPGTLLSYCYANQQMVITLVSLTSMIPVIQCLLLLSWSQPPFEKRTGQALSLFASTLVFMRHFSAVLGEQLLQIIIRAAFFNYGRGYLSLLAIFVRIYSALRFILIDSYIGSKLASWKKELQNGDHYLLKITHSLFWNGSLILLSLLISLQSSHHFLQTAVNMVILLIFGFYFSTLARIIYFKINRHENNTALVLRFAGYELFFVVLAFMLTRQLHDPLLPLIWLGYSVKPFAQILFLRKRFVAIHQHNAFVSEPASSQQAG